MKVTEVRECVRRSEGRGDKRDGKEELKDVTAEEECEEETSRESGGGVKNGRAGSPTKFSCSLRGEGAADAVEASLQIVTRRPSRRRTERNKDTVLRALQVERGDPGTSEEKTEAATGDTQMMCTEEREERWRERGERKGDEDTENEEDEK